MSKCIVCNVLYFKAQYLLRLRSPLSILYNSKFILMATALETNAVVVTRVHCTQLRGIGTFIEETTPSKLFCLPSVKKYTLKERICSPLEQFLTFSSRFLFRRDLLCRKANRKSYNLSPLFKWPKYLPSVPKPVNIVLT